MKRILVSIISATVLLISSCAVAQPKKSTTRLPEEHLLQLDAQASSLVAEMSRQRIAVWREMRVSGGASALAPSAAAKAGDLKRASLISENRRLLMSEQKVNEAFEAAYRNTTRKLDVNNRLLVVRIAALHWHTQFRRHLQRGLHTSVPGLDSDPRCDGDVVADQLFLNYLRTVWGDSTSSVTEVVETLEPLARQSACLGVEQSEALASAATEAFYDVEAFLRMHQMEWVIPPLASMLTQPFLLFYDVEKYRGINSPFARWFSRYESVLLDMIRQKRSPMLWHGVWLYDRLSGRLLGFSNTARPRNENEVRLDLLLTSLVIPENLGAGSCSLAEMVERGFGHWGYMCAGVACNIDSQASSMAAQIIRGKSPKAADQLSIFDILHTASGLGRISGTLLGMTCGAPGGDAGANGGGRLCNLVGSNDVVTPAAQTIACISRQVVRPGTEVMACLMESTGYCSSPVDHLTKDLQEADMVGVPLGKECTIGNPNADEQSPTRPLSPDTRQELQNAQNKADQAKTQDDLAKDRKDDAQKKDDQASDDLSRAQAAEKSARDALRKASQDPNTKPSDLQAARDKLNQAQQDAADAQTNKNGADADLQAAKDALGRADAALREAREELQKIQDKARE